jgi:hypothetical protein
MRLDIGEISARPSQQYERAASADDVQRPGADGERARCWIPGEGKDVTISNLVGINSFSRRSGMSGNVAGQSERPQRPLRSASDAGHLRPGSCVAQWSRRPATSARPDPAVDKHVFKSDATARARSRLPTEQGHSDWRRSRARRRRPTLSLIGRSIPLGTAISRAGAKNDEHRCRDHARREPHHQDPEDQHALDAAPRP